MANPMISVVVPVYNVEQYIKLCVDSILAQTFTDFEIILVDDASPDKSVDICQKLYGGNEKVRIIRHEQNRGLGPARNTGMKHARGKYIYFVDSDDFILPNALEKFFSAAEKTNAQVIHAAGHYKLTQDEPLPIRQENLKLSWDRYSKEGFLPPDVLQRIELWRRNTMQPTAWLYFCRRDFLQTKQLEFLPIVSEDEPFHFALLCLAERYYVLREALYVYRRRAGSIMRIKNPAQLAKAINSIALASNYVGRLLDRMPRFKNFDLWRQSIMDEFIKRFTKNHTKPYYENLSVSPEVNAAIDTTLGKIFGGGKEFVKYFFNGYNLYRRREELVKQQAQALFKRSQHQQNLMTKFFREQPALLDIMSAAKSDGKRVFLLGTPMHGNLGDQAIALGEFHVLKKFFPDRKIIEVPYDYLTGDLGEFLWGLSFERHIRRDDIIATIGGGNLGNLWVGEEILRRKLIEKFPRNKIVIFPQSIYFSADDDGRRELATSQKIYNAHRDLHLMTRDENSFNLARKIFPRINNYLLPDVATTLRGIVDDAQVERRGVLFVLRRDKEKARDDTKIQSLQKFLAAQKIPFAVTDTVIGRKVPLNDREQIVRDMLMNFRRSKLVITDRFHGVIFSFVTRTPVLAFKSFDTKISSGIRWFRNLPSVFYAEDSDRPAMENFITANYFADESFAALNIETDADERFTRALNQIISSTPPKQTGDLSTLHTPPSIPEQVDSSRRLTLDAVNVSGNRISFKYTVQGNWQRCFTGAEFFIEYSEDISATPKSIAVIPFLCNVLPIAWVLNAEVVVDELDSDFYEHLPEIKRGYVEMYPCINFGVKLTVDELVKQDYEVSDETAAFFSGGVDSFETLIAHADERPTLITLFGSNVKLTDIKGCSRVQRHATDVARQFGCKNLFVASTFRTFLRDGLLSNLVYPLANDGWWHGFQHGIGIIGHAAPYAYLHRLKAIYFASTFTADLKTTCASDPTIDNHVHIGKCVTIHDGYEFSRQDKIRRICDFSRRTGTPINLRVCWESSGGGNCCACEKCYRTICGLLAEGENPADYGFADYTPATLEKMRRDFQRPNFVYSVVSKLWQDIRNRFRERPENLPQNLSWLMERKFL